MVRFTEKLVIDSTAMGGKLTIHTYIYGKDVRTKAIEVTGVAGCCSFDGGCGGVSLRVKDSGGRGGVMAGDRGRGDGGFGSHHNRPLSQILLIMADNGKIDPHSPYYLGSGDQPGNMITHVIFSNDNYITWARAIKLSLKARRKFVFVDGTFTKPTEMEKKKQLDWDIVNSMLVSWITRTLDPKLAASIPFHDEAK
ncbi:hypothetical protein F0562_015626 [Nyssa sinensis]|uniref:Retrotransposon Copia-like N-terminal domain-containing protein n=1 Tax=Nyssa sinensis TaxID=561372 RepID=A0A5J4ZKV6_9ASTE|nr:hypothetical protein F0562_015626 [Nyssa sinensis]